MSRWREGIKIHPAEDLFPLMSPEELKMLGEDIKASGMKVPIVILQQKDRDWRFLKSRAASNSGPRSTPTASSASSRLRPSSTKTGVWHWRMKSRLTV